MDEMFSFVYSQKPWLESLKFWTWETNPPLHMFILKVWFYLFPTNEFWSRLPSLIFGVASIFLIYQLSEKLFNKRVAVLCALFLALSPIHILYSVTARTYSLLILLSILSVKYFLEIFYFNQKNKPTIRMFSLINLFFLYSHLTGLVAILCQFIVLLAYKKDRVKDWIVYNIIPLGIWSIWAVPSIHYKLNLQTLQNILFFNTQHDFWDTIRSLQFFFIGLGLNKYIALLFFIVFFILFLSKIIRQARQKQTDERVLILSFLLFTPIMIFLTFGLSVPKFYLAALPWLAIIWGYTIDGYLDNHVIKFLSFIIFIPGLVNLFNSLPVNNWDTACEFLNKNNNGSQILIYDNYTNKNEIDYYCHLKIPAIPYLPTTVMNWDQFLITQNYQHLEPTEQELKDWIKRKKITYFNQIFLIQNSSNDNINIDIVKILEKNGYHQLMPPKNIRVLNQPSLYWFGH